MKALEILNNKEVYTSILNGKTPSILVTKKDEKLSFENDPIGPTSTYKYHHQIFPSSKLAASL